MPVTGTETVIKEEVVKADGWEVIAIHIVKPIDLEDETNPHRLRVVWACTLAGVDTGETVEALLEGQEALDYMVSETTLYTGLSVAATALGKAQGVLPIDAV